MPETKRKLIDLSKETIKNLTLEAIQLDFGSVKAFIESILTERAEKYSKKQGKK